MYSSPLRPAETPQQKRSVKMIILWAALLFLHQGYSLVPVKTAHLGEAATLTCARTTKELSSRVQWYKQSVGDTLNLVVTFYGTTQPVYTPEFPESRFEAKIDKNFVNLTIVKTVQEDEGYYHCEQGSRVSSEWSGMYLSVKGNTQRSSNYIVVQKQMESNPVYSGDTATLECSVFSDSENETCPGDQNVFWFRAGSHPNIIYTDRKRHEYENRSDPQKRCVYGFSKNVSSSDAGTHYCAVAACGEIISGNGTKLNIQGTCPIDF
ncbi:signal-regulatory protein beta-2-like [Neolamprologus brichardi]|uniref:signal-regulatory protein beta-2-like n=1 Tax=Neolamprologus brichardi TaxID=32507 RepID=UPI001643C2AB|nr:signal-regulatory protein beta-2-like [Neolamprologus brichardi]